MNNKIKFIAVASALAMSLSACSGTPTETQTSKPTAQVSQIFSNLKPSNGSKEFEEKMKKKEDEHKSRNPDVVLKTFSDSTANNGNSLFMFNANEENSISDTSKWGSSNALKDVLTNEGFLEQSRDVMSIATFGAMFSIKGFKDYDLSIMNGLVATEDFVKKMSSENLEPELKEVLPQFSGESLGLTLADGHRLFVFGEAKGATFKANYTDESKKKAIVFAPVLVALPVKTDESDKVATKIVVKNYNMKFSLVRNENFDKSGGSGFFQAPMLVDDVEIISKGEAPALMTQEEYKNSRKSQSKANLESGWARLHELGVE